MGACLYTDARILLACPLLKGLSIVGVPSLVAINAGQNYLIHRPLLIVPGRQQRKKFFFLFLPLTEWEQTAWEQENLFKCTCTCTKISSQTEDITPSTSY